MIALYLARGVLWLCAPNDDHDAILGDLVEEHRLEEHGGGRWLLSQALRSAIPLLTARWRRGELAGMIAAALVTILVPLRLTDMLWRFVHSQVPRKADLNWSIGFWIANLVIAICGAYVLRLASRELRTAVTLAILAVTCAGLTILMSAGHVPVWYAVLLLVCIPLVCLIPNPKQQKEA